MSHHDKDNLFRFPQTYHSHHAEAIYEQCPWDRDHVEAIYPILKGRLLTDGGWHDIPNDSGQPWIGRYHVTADYFQAVYAQGQTNKVFDQLTAMEPLRMEHDAEWAVWHLDEPDGSIWYAVSSTFATTPGQFAHQPAVDEWLWRHGLGLEPNERFVEGVAYFETIKPGCFLDAIQRLHWLESVFADLKAHLEKVGADFWAEIKQQSDLIDIRSQGDRGTDEIVPLPERTIGEGAKERVPVRYGK